MDDAVITGIGILVAGCDRRRLLWQQLHRSHSQLSLWPDPAIPDRLRPMGLVHGFDAGNYLGSFPARFYDRTPRDTQLFLSALMLARGDAALEAADPDRMGIFDGTARGGF